MLEIKPFINNNSARITSNYYDGMQYAFVSKKHEQCHPLVWCKDYLHFAIRNRLYCTEDNIHNFYYKVTDPQIDLKNTRLMLVNNKDPNFFQKIQYCIDFVNQVEKELGLKHSQFQECKDNIFLVEGSKNWLLAPPLISCYSLLLRAGCSHKIGTPWRETINKIEKGLIVPYQKKDSDFLIQAKNGINRLIKENFRKIFSRKIKDNYPKDLDKVTFYNYYGIVSLSQKNYDLKNTKPEWFLEKI